MIYGLDLFSGIGGISLALAEWVTPVAYCEIDTYCQGVLISRMLEGKLHTAPIWDNVKTLSRSALPDTKIDIISGGFPCQDISIAGHGEGLAGERSGLFFEIVRLAKEFNPKFLFLENVPNIRTKGLREVVKTLSDLGYDCRWTIMSASDVGACHQRKRWWLLAYSRGERCNNGCNNGEGGYVLSNEHRNAEKGKQERERWIGGVGEVDEFFADTLSNGSFKGDGAIQPEKSETIRQDNRRLLQDQDWIEAVTEICRMDDGIRCRVDRVKSLGNSVVPIQAKEAFKKLMGLSMSNGEI